MVVFQKSPKAAENTDNMQNKRMLASLVLVYTQLQTTSSVSFRLIQIRRKICICLMLFHYCVYTSFSVTNDEYQASNVKLYILQ